MINSFVIRDSILVRKDSNYTDYVQSLNESNVESPEMVLTEEEFYKPILQEATWIDLLDTTSEERKIVQDNMGISLAREIELEDIEASARFFEDDEGLHLHSFFYYEDENDFASLETVAFNIKDNRLYTLRNEELPAFRLYRLRSRNSKLFSNTPYEIILDLFETKVEQLADVIEYIYTELEKIGRIILDSNNIGSYSLNQTLLDLTNLEDSNSKIGLCLMDTQRALSFLLRKTRLPEELLEQAREILRDLESIKPNTDTVFQRIDFLMQAAMGLVTIDQNRIIKIFSVVSVIFLPPTLVASIYGMNFHHMPELASKYGYPFALLLMLLSAIGPFLFFKFKKWL